MPTVCILTQLWCMCIPTLHTLVVRNAIHNYFIYFSEPIHQMFMWKCVCWLL